MQQKAKKLTNTSVLLIDESTTLSHKSAFCSYYLLCSVIKTSVQSSCRLARNEIMSSIRDCMHMRYVYVFLDKTYARIIRL